MNAILANTPLELQGLVGGVLQALGRIGVSIGNAVITSLLGELEQGVKTLDEIVLFNASIDTFAIMFATCWFNKEVKAGKEMDKEAVKEVD